MTNIGIMQPYFLPYIGYFQLIAHVDRFVVYDRIEYTKKGWINRNRMLRNGAAATFSLPLAKGSDRLDVRDREIAESFEPGKMLNQIRGAYAKAPHFGAVMPVIEGVLRHKSETLFDFILHALRAVCEYLGIDTPLVVSSHVESAPDLRGQDRVLGLCADLGATCYTNPIGGFELYDPDAFRARGLDLRFLKTGDVTYPQFENAFEPHLSILDVMMFNSPNEISTFLQDGYALIRKDAA